MFNTDAEAVKILLKEGADVNAKDIAGANAFMWAAMLNPNVDVLKTLLEAEADIHTRSTGGITALEASFMNKNPEVRNFLEDFVCIHW